MKMSWSSSKKIRPFKICSQSFKSRIRAWRVNKTLLKHQLKSSILIICQKSLIWEKGYKLLKKKRFRYSKRKIISHLNWDFFVQNWSASLSRVRCKLKRLKDWVKYLLKLMTIQLAAKVYSIWQKRLENWDLPTLKRFVNSKFLNIKFKSLENLMRSGSQITLSKLMNLMKLTLILRTRLIFWEIILNQQVEPEDRQMAKQTQHLFQTVASFSRREWTKLKLKMSLSELAS